MSEQVVSPIGAIVVGIDAREEARESNNAAVVWAVEEAKHHRRPLHLLHAVSWPILESPDVFNGGLDILKTAGQAILDDAADQVRQLAPEVEVSSQLVVAAPTTALLEAAQDATLVVLGARGVSALGSLLLGSVGVHVTTHAACPVVVMRQPAERQGVDAGQVVVGIDGSELSKEAIRFAFEEASHRRLGVTAIHAMPVPRYPEGLADPLAGMPLMTSNFDNGEEEALLLLAESLAGWREKYPDVPVVQRLVRDRPQQALVEAATGAALLVVGSRGRGGFKGMLLGSVSLAALHHARSPVAVVRTRT
jgi:nucleotide-binding universal stress UspA family protein